MNRKSAQLVSKPLLESTTISVRGNVHTVSSKGACKENFGQVKTMTVLPFDVLATSSSSKMADSDISRATSSASKNSSLESSYTLSPMSSRASSYALEL